MNKSRIIATLLFLLGGFLLSFSRLTLALTSNQNPSEWLSNTKYILIFADEILAFSIILLGTAIIIIVQQNFCYFPIHSALIGVSFLTAIICWIIVTLNLGRIVYPVNGLNVIKNQLSVYQTQIFGALHLSDLALGIGTIALASIDINENRKVALSGIIAGLFQLFSTYYSFPINKSLFVVATLSWLVWILIYTYIAVFMIPHHYP